MTDAAIRMISGLTVDFADFAMVPERDGADGLCGECVSISSWRRETSTSGVVVLGVIGVPDLDEAENPRGQT